MGIFIQYTSKLQLVGKFVMKQVFMKNVHLSKSKCSADLQCIVNF